ncbi:hypothetical protein COT77_01450 [Candidatus Berkelbacteria bacterium CG10_big_fil_rev_8_21_14_0_10_41_12]|uniref:Glycosyl transferase n=1 Tax=Candidatus Berkelbacteria bacterium CG10_big_fil_rev_8_21_14_0_10_41_12 TaxID=1974513 RepID=A0A2M6WXB5_9BACT|nr:MAG: hypothetical protein COT77_01450 [Candidatus Berkelbacteria bacterium CG10_big_fil_rev_8_21_14_0_10_41_12]
MKIAVIIPPFTTLPTIGQGGTERIAEGLINELLKRDHEVTLLGAGNCQTKANFVQIFRRTISEQKFDNAFVEASRPLRIETAYITKVMKYLADHDGEFDVVFNHMRGGFLIMPLAQKLKMPIISVFHLPLFEEVIDAVSQFENPNVISISNNQRKPAGDRINFLSTVYNGLDLSEFEYNDKPENYFMFMGAMGEHKRPHLAIEAAKKAGVKLVLVGGKKREPYFSEMIAPRIDDENVKYLGEVESVERIKVFKNAKGFLFPINWEEPFGLVVIESMASGTPVIAFNHGAMSEIIDDGKDGFVVENVDEMAEAIGKIDQINRSLCRKKVEEKFTYGKMVDGYLEAFETIKDK